jgi:hypothetical protein
MDLFLTVDKLTAERFLHTPPERRWKMMDLIANTRPDAISFSEPTMVEEEGSADEAPPAATD